MDFHLNVRFGRSELKFTQTLAIAECWAFLGREIQPGSCSDAGVAVSGGFGPSPRDRLPLHSPVC